MFDRFCSCVCCVIALLTSGYHPIKFRRAWDLVLVLSSLYSPSPVRKMKKAGNIPPLQTHSTPPNVSFLPHYNPVFNETDTAERRRRIVSLFDGMGQRSSNAIHCLEARLKERACRRRLPKKWESLSRLCGASGWMLFSPRMCTREK